MTESMRFVGLDVHANQTHAGILDLDSGELRRRRLSGDPLVALPLLELLGAETVAVYEAGPTGFGLARAARDRGLDVRVCAPGLIPRKPADRVKTDARDAERLARLLAAGELSFVRVPEIAEEQLRDLVRAREDLRGDLNRARQRLSHFLRRRGIRFEGPGNTWTIRHHRWLRRLEFEDRASKVTFADYLAAVEALGQRRSALETTLAELAPESPWAETIARLRCFRGIDTLAAAGLCAEIGTSSASRIPASSAPSSAWSPPSAPRTRSAARARSPRPGPSTRAGCWSKPPSTAGADRGPQTSCAPVRRARIRAWSRWPGAPSIAFTANGQSSRSSAESPPTSRPWPARAS